MAGRKVVIDTDAGIDDAVALFLALAAHLDPQDPFEIVGITTVMGNTSVDYVNRNVFIVLDTVGVRIPVYSGAAVPLVVPFDRGELPYYGVDGFGDIPPAQLPIKGDSQSRVQQEYAPQALARLAREYKGELTVVALGPLTNLAVAMRLDPEFSNNLRDVYVMGGNTKAVGNIRFCAEFNFFVDPEAALVVLANPPRGCKENLVILPWETCKMVMSPLEWRREVLGKIDCAPMRLMNFIEDPILNRNEQRRYKRWVSADAVCVALLLHPEIVTGKITNYCTVELQGVHTRGQMVLDHPQRSGIPHTAVVIDEVDTDQLQDVLVKRFKKFSTFK